MKKIAALLLGVVLILSTQGPRAAQAANTLTRSLDPVVVMGAAMPGFAGVPLTQLFVYKYGGGVWTQIPWQFDEAKASDPATIVPSDNGVLDAQDQFVFMAADAGDRAPARAWVPDASARTFARYELAVNDPLDPSQHAWVYVFRSQTLASTITTDYVSYDAGTLLLTSDRYKLGQLAGHPGFDRLELNGSGVDILDRTKIRVLLFGVPNTENDLPIGPPVLTRAGHVRVVLNGGLMLAYRSFYANLIPVDLRPYMLTPQWGRFSIDMSAAASGSHYYDPNVPAGVVIDGVPDPVPATPAADWSQVSGPTGTVVRAFDFSSAGGTATTFYRDNATPEIPDTGEPGSYGDAGVMIANPGQVFNLVTWNYVLPASQPNVGAAYRDYARHPLQVQPAESLPFATYLPVILNNAQ